MSRINVDGWMVFDSSDGDLIMSHGSKSQKKKNPVYLLLIGGTDDIIIETNEGPLSAHPGDCVAYDPISSHVWPVAASYVLQHYEPWDIN